MQQALGGVITPARRSRRHRGSPSAAGPAPNPTRCRQVRRPAILPVAPTGSSPPPPGKPLRDDWPSGRLAIETPDRRALGRRDAVAANHGRSLSQKRRAAALCDLFQLAPAPHADARRHPASRPAAHPRQPPGPAGGCGRSSPDPGQAAPGPARCRGVAPPRITPLATAPPPRADRANGRHR